MADHTQLRKFRVVFLREYLERVRSKWFVVATLIGPFFFLGIMVVGPVIAMRARITGDAANVAIIDATGTDLGRRVATALGELAGAGGTKPGVDVVAPGAALAAAESSAVQAVVRSERRGYVVLDAETLAGRKIRYAGRNATSMLDMEHLERTVQRALVGMRLEKEGLDAERVTMLTNVNLERETTKISDKGVERAGGTSSLIFANVMFFVFYFLIALYGQAMMRGVLEEKTTRVAEVVVSSARPSTLLAGKVLGVGAVAMTQVTVWAALVTVFYQARVPILAAFGVPAMAAEAVRLPSIEPWVAVALLLLFGLGFIFYCALYAAVAAMVSSQEDLNQAQWPVSLLLIASVVLWQAVAMKPEGTVAMALSFLPFSAPLIMPMRMALIPVPWAQVALALLSVGTGCALAVWVAARIYRVGMLMYGKRPGLREVARWLRYS